ncbi:MAG: hypothetical protein QM654_06360 [Dysgonamonadaceae bacterium]
MKEKEIDTNSMTSANLSVRHAPLNDRDKAVKKKHPYMKPEIRVVKVEMESSFTAHSGIHFTNSHPDIDNWEDGGTESTTGQFGWE